MGHKINPLFYRLGTSVDWKYQLRDPLLANIFIYRLVRSLVLHYSAPYVSYKVGRTTSRTHQSASRKLIKRKSGKLLLLKNVNDLVASRKRMAKNPFFNHSFVFSHLNISYSPYLFISIFLLDGAAEHERIKKKLPEKYFYYLSGKKTRNVRGRWFAYFRSYLFILNQKPRLKPALRLYYFKKIRRCFNSRILYVRTRNLLDRTALNKERKRKHKKVYKRESKAVRFKRMRQQAENAKFKQRNLYRKHKYRSKNKKVRVFIKKYNYVLDTSYTRFARIHLPLTKVFSIPKWRFGKRVLRRKRCRYGRMRLLVYKRKNIKKLRLLRTKAKPRFILRKKWRWNLQVDKVKRNKKLRIRMKYYGASKLVRPKKIRRSLRWKMRIHPIRKRVLQKRRYIKKQFRKSKLMFRRLPIWFASFVPFVYNKHTSYRVMKNLKILRFLLRYFRFYKNILSKKRLLFFHLLIITLSTLITLLPTNITSKKLFLFLHLCYMYLYSFRYLHFQYNKKIFQSRFIRYNLLSKFILFSLKKVSFMNADNKLILRYYGLHNRNFSAQFLLNYIIIKLGQYFKLNSILNPILNRLRRLATVKGYRFIISGRLTRRERAAFILRSFKRMPLSRKTAHIDSAQDFKIMKFGVVGIKIYILHEKTPPYYYLFEFRSRL